MKTPMELVQDACLEATAKGYLEPYEEMKSAALILARGIILRAGQLAPEKAEMPTIPALLPCPFCGSTRLTLENLGEGDDWFVSCQGCEVQQIANYSKEEAMERWNRRPAFGDK